MIEAITPDKLYLILPFKVSQLALLYSKDKEISIIQALKDIYASRTYALLSREETKLWHYGPVALYEFYQDNG